MKDIVGDCYTKALFGEKAVHVPAWVKIQNQGADGVLFVGASRMPNLNYGSDATHRLVIGEIIVRPHLILASNHLRGAGLTHLARECDVEAWLDNGTVLFDGVGALAGMNAQKEGTRR